ncbi:hypothetical protein KCU97_g25, partial [Aureobasidium melanogenum]
MELVVAPTRGVAPKRTSQSANNASLSCDRLRRSQEVLNTACAMFLRPHFSSVPPRATEGANLLRLVGNIKYYNGQIRMSRSRSMLQHAADRAMLGLAKSVASTV